MTHESVFKPEDLLRMTRRQPFVPFRIHLTDGASYEVPHPELLWVFARLIAVGVPHARREGFFEDMHLCPILHITRIEPLADAG